MKIARSSEVVEELMRIDYNNMMLNSICGIITDLVNDPEFKLVVSVDRYNKAKNKDTFIVDSIMSLMKAYKGEVEVSRMHYNTLVKVLRGVAAKYTVYYLDTPIRRFCDKLRGVVGTYDNCVLESVRDDKGSMFVYKAASPIGQFEQPPTICSIGTTMDYPVLFMNNHCWMTVTPNEIGTMEDNIKKAHGKVLTCGLGLGYFAYMCCIKEDVESVTVVENNEAVIQLFKKYIAPRFKKEFKKLDIIFYDAFEVADMLTDGVYDYCFVDIWRGVDDIDIYLKSLKHFELLKKTEVDYWVEDAFGYYIRQAVCCDVCGDSLGYPMFVDNPIISKLIDTVVIENVEDINEQLSWTSLRRRLVDIVMEIDFK